MILAIVAGGGTAVGSVLTYLGVRGRTSSDGESRFRGDLLDRVAHLETRLDDERRSCQEQLDVLRRDLVSERVRCDEQLQTLEEKMRAETNEKLRRQAASIRSEYRRDLEEVSSAD